MLPAAITELAISGLPLGPVILLADSHGLIFSAGGDMHTTGAGLGEQLAHELGIPVTAHAAMSVRQLADITGAQCATLGDKVDNNKIITDAVHFGEI